MLISRLDGMESYAFGRCRVVIDKNGRSITERGCFDHQFFEVRPMPHRSQQKHHSSETQCRLLYVGSDLALLKFLRSTFGKPKYHVVSCPDRDSAEMFINSQIQY